MATRPAAPGAARVMATEGALARAVTAQCIELLRDTYLPHLKLALAELPPQDLWWRPHERATSAGNLLLHLQGNIRQWIVSGLGGAPDARERDAEFATRGAGMLQADAALGTPASETRAETAAAADTLAALDATRLFESLTATVHEACAIIERLDAARLVAPVTIQGFETNVFGAVLHVTEHLSWHTGQITWIAKLRAGERHGIAFYDDAALGTARNGERDRG